MRRQDVNTVLSLFKSQLSREKIESLARSSGFCKRQRKVRPYELLQSLIVSFCSPDIRHLSTLHEIYVNFSDIWLENKPFYNQLSKPAFPVFLRECASHLLSSCFTDRFNIAAGTPLSRLEHIYIQDGTSFSIKDGLQAIYPGRFTAYKPAAVELHVTYDFISGMPVKIDLTPDASDERASLPAPKTLKKCLLIADRGYPKRSYFNAMTREGAFYLMRGISNINPLVLKAHPADGVSINHWAGKKLKAIKSLLPQVHLLDLDTHSFPLKNALPERTIMRRDPKTHQYDFLLTNLPRDHFSAENVSQMYRLRWEIELLFKEWKSFSNLKAFDTNNPHIAEGLIWAALIAAIVKKMIAQCTQSLHKVHVSPLKTAKIAHLYIADILKALSQHRDTFYKCFIRCTTFLAKHAKKTKDKRNNISPHLALGIYPAFDVP